MQKTVTIPFMLMGILFNVCLIASNLLETKVIQVGGITATAGLMVFPISYIINDCIAEVWGYKKARLIIWSGFAMNFLVVAFAQLAIMLPGAPFWKAKKDSTSYSVWLRASYLPVCVLSWWDHLSMLM